MTEIRHARNVLGQYQLITEVIKKGASSNYERLRMLSVLGSMIARDHEMFPALRPHVQLPLRMIAEAVLDFEISDEIDELLPLRLTLIVWVCERLIEDLGNENTVPF